MIKQAMSEAGLEVLAVGGLLTFVAVFLGVTAWVMTRGKKEVDTWSSLPLADGYDPVEPRLPIVTKPSDQDGGGAPGGDGPLDNQGGSARGEHDHHAEGGCGKCENCTCHGESAETVTTLALN